jgi:hypothetical protein
VITMDADLQDSPEEIPGLYNMITPKLWFGFRLEEKRYDSVVAKTYLQNYSTGRLEKRL